MRLIRRRPPEEQPEGGSGAAGPTGSGDLVRDGRSPGKGRPTPRRSEAQRRRTGPVPPPPRTRREAARRQRELGATRRGDGDTAARLRAGDESVLPRRDQGPERALVRDVIDSRRNAGGAFLLVALLVLASYAVPSPVFKVAVLYLWMAVFALMVFDSVLIGLRIKRLVTQRFPRSTQGTVRLTLYGVNRTILPRRWRLPRARVGVGDKV